MTLKLLYFTLKKKGKEMSISEKNANIVNSMFDEKFSYLSDEERQVLKDYILKSTNDAPYVTSDGHSSELRKVFGKMISNDPEKNPDFKDLQDAYKKFGLDVIETKGKCYHSSTIVTASYDGVTYSLDDNNEYLNHGSERRIIQDIKAREYVIEKYHKIIKEIYEYCVNLNVGDIWVLVSGHYRPSLFIGNSTGYIASMSFSEPDENGDYDEDDIFGEDGKALHLVRPNWKSNNILFENKFKVKGVYLELRE